MHKKLFPLTCLLIASIQFAAAQIPNGYYNTANGLTGAPLKTALYNIIRDHTVVSYSGLWSAFYTTDDQANQSILVWDMYSNCNYTLGPGDQCGTYVNECDCYNREHSFPQSWFNSSSPMVSDLFHIYPTDGKVNGMRNNYPFGETDNPTYISGNGSKLGYSGFAGYSGIVFEPVDEYKGDFARSYFYMATRYENLIAAWQNNGNADEVLNGTTYPCYDDWFVNLLISWHNFDPVSVKEIDRNNTVYYSFQNNRNPYIDHPEYVSAVWGGTTVLPEPSNHVLAFAVSNSTSASLTLTWNDNDGAQPAEKFLILANNTGIFNSPVDGSPIADDPYLNDNSGALNIAHGVQSCTWSGLSAGSTYYFKIWPYTNNGNDINFKTNGSVPTANGTTLLSASLTATPATLSGFGYTVGAGPSASQSYTLSGNNLTPASGYILISGSANYEVSANNSNFGTSVSLPYSGNTLPATQVYVRLKAGLSAGSYSGETIINTGGGALSCAVTCSGSVTTAMLPQIAVSSPAIAPGNVLTGSLNNILYCSKIEVSQQPTTLQQIVYQLNGTYLDNDIAPAGLQLYSNSTFDFNTAQLLGLAQSSNLSVTSGQLTFTGLGKTIPAGTALYVWLTADISGTATPYHTLQEAATTNQNYTFSSGNVSGTQSPGGIQTITGLNTLVAGDIAFSGIQTDDPDKFSFVLLRDFVSGTSLSFTDCAWDEDQLLSNEGTLTWISPSTTLPKGTVVTVMINTTPSVSTGNITQTGSFQLSVSGDQILAYTGTSDSPQFIAGISSEGWLNSGNVSAGTSYLPVELTLYTNACGFASETDNSVYSGPKTATPEALRALLNYPDNYIRSDAIQAFLPWTFPLGLQTIINTNSSVSTLLINSGQLCTVNPGVFLTVNQSLINNSGTQGLLLESTAGGSASLLHNTTGVGATIQRFVTGEINGNHTYHLVSIPFEQNAGINTSLFNGCKMFRFDTSSSGLDPEWIDLGNSPSLPLENTKGYRLYYPLSQNITYNQTGLLNSGNFAIPLTNNGEGKGFNLVPNPYPSAIDWNAGAGWQRPSVCGSLWQWKQNTGNFGIWVQGLSVNNGSNIIPAGQSFFVYSDNNQILTINNIARLHSNLSFGKQQGSNENNFKLSVEGNGYSDEILIHFDQDAIPGYDPANDALKLAGLPEAPQLSMINADNFLSINNIPISETFTAIPLLFSINTENTISFMASGLQTIDPDLEIFFDDLLLNHTINLRNQPEYEVDYPGGSSSNRFRLRFGINTPISKPYPMVSGTATYCNGNLAVDIPAFVNQNVRLQIVNATGQIILSNQLKLMQNHTIAHYLPSGIYVLIINSGKQYFRTKITGGF